MMKNLTKLFTRYRRYYSHDRGGRLQIGPFPLLLISNHLSVSGLLKEYLRELPEPVFSSCLYQMLLDALGVFLPDDPEGNAKLVFSILDCLPKSNRVSTGWPKNVYLRHYFENSDMVSKSKL